MRTIRWIIVIWVSLIAAVLVFDVRRRAVPVLTDAPALATSSRPGMWTGSASCVGRSCHGGLEPRPGDVCRQDEYTTIATRDPHSRAFRVLQSERSREMARLLGDPGGAADRMPRCLACHATPVDESLAQTERSYGVGCESCHGPAASWIDEHYRTPKPPGLVRLDQPDVRAKTCAGCHVGAAGRDVDHDLIAAGHPRLLFELVAFDEELPPHWRPKARNVANDWLFGQIAGAEAALDVLTARAQSKTAPWPEFAEFDCFSCHHDLKADSWRQAVPRKQKAGSLVWNSWNTSVIDRLLVENKLSADPWHTLRDTMRSFSPNREEIVTKTAAAKAPLAELTGVAKLDSSNSSREAGILRLKAFVDSPPNFESWEAAEQHWLAVRALWIATKDPELVPLLDALGTRRGLVSGFDSPRNFDPREGIRPKR